MVWRSRREAMISGIGLVWALSGPAGSSGADSPALKPDPTATATSKGSADTTPSSSRAATTPAAGARPPDHSPPATGAQSAPHTENAPKGDGKATTPAPPAHTPPTGHGASKVKITVSGSRAAAARSRTPGRPAPARDLAKILGPLPHKRVSMDFRGMDVDNVLLTFSTWAGVTIVKDSGLTGNMNLVQGQEIPLLDAFKILEAVLNQKGFTIDRDGPVLRVVPKTAPAPPPPPPSTPGPPKPPEPAPEDRVTRIFPLTYASAQSVARIVNDLFGSGGGGGGPQPGQPGGPQPDKSGGPPPGQPGRPPPGPSPGGTGGKSKKGATVKASPDFDTNQIIVSGDPLIMPDVEKVVKDLDHKTEIPLATRSYHIQYAEVNDVARQVAAVLQSIAGTGRTSPFQDVPFERRVLGGGGGDGKFYNPFGTANNGPVTEAGGRVISDPRTNTLTVIASEEQHVQIKKIIDALDQRVEYASTTFILPLKHLEADEAAFTLGQLFRRQNNNNGFPFFLFGGGGGQNNQQVRQRRRIGDPNSPRPGRSSQQRNIFGFGSDSGADRPVDDGSNVQAASSASHAPPRTLPRDPIRPDSPPPENPQLHVQAVDTGESDPTIGPLSTTVTLDGAQLAQWWFDQQQSQQTTGRDEAGHVRPLVDLQGKITIVPDLNSNALIVNTSPSNLPALKEVLAMIDRQPAQVLIEGIIVEATLDNTTKLGVTLNWNETHAFDSKRTAQTTTIDLAAPDAVGGLSIKAIGASFDAVVKAVKSDRRFNVLSTPRVMTLNNRQAAITVGQQVPILNQETTFGNTTSRIDFKDVGVVLDVTPHISADGYVNIEVAEDADEISGFSTLNNNQVPIVARRSAETTITAKDGQTIVLGGLIRHSAHTNHTRFPILGDLPIVGSLFRSKDKTSDKTELMLFMRARVVRYDDEVDAVTQQQSTEAGIKANSTAGKHLDLPKVDTGSPRPDSTAPPGKGPLPPISTGPT